MRTFIYVFSVAAILLLGCRDGSRDSGKPALGFYVVSHIKLAGGRLIDTPEFPKLGYVPAKPNLLVTKLKAVAPETPQEQPAAGATERKETSQGVEKRARLYIMMDAEDARKFTALTEQALGKQVLLMLGDKPVTALAIKERIDTPSLLLTLPDKINAKQVEDGLKQLTK